MIKALMLLISVSGCSPYTLEQQHAAVMRQHVYISDQEQFGVKELENENID